MDTSDIPLLSMLKQRMTWLGQRQNLLSQNVVNVDTPGFSARELKPMDFAKALQNATGIGSAKTLTLTDPKHIAAPSGGANAYEDYKAPDVAADPSGNTVSLEQEMIKVADTQAQFQAATNLYAKTLGMMKTAIGKSGS